MRVGIIQTYKPIFTSIRRPEQNYPVARPDTFEKTEFDFNKECDIYYSKLQKAMEIVSPQDVAVKAVRVSKKTGVGVDDVYKTMALLSQYSSNKSLEFIEKSLRDYGLEAMVGINNLDKSIPLTNVMSYICLKNFDTHAENNAVMVDSDLINTFKSMDTKEKRDFNRYINEQGLKLVYFDNFENGYNFLNQEKSFENFTIDVIKKAKKFQEKNKKSLYYNVQYVLNGENYKNMKVFPGHVNVIRQDDIATPEKIADNLNPIMPSKEDFKSVINEISYGNVKAQKEILEFLNKTLTVVTPRLYCKYLQNIHKQFLKYLEQQGKTMDDVYFVIPSIEKSFMPANYAYMKVNHIENPKYLFLSKNEELQSEQIENLPENAVAVIVDDCVLSGLSMKEEVFPYKELMHTLSKDKNIVFAPIIALNIGKQILENLADKSNRDDKFICGKLLPDYRMRSKNLTLEFDKVWNSHLTTSVIFPYMGPDFNCEELIPLYGKFLYNENAQKCYCGKMNNFTLA